MIGDGATGDGAWIDNSGDGTLQYDFYPPRDWTDERIAAEQAAIAGLLERPANAPAPGWLGLAARLPAGLKRAVIAELRAGNRLTGIGSTGWPADGSIVVNMRERFSAARQVPGIAWRRLDDPRYAREELSEQAEGVECLVIT